MEKFVQKVNLKLVKKGRKYRKSKIAGGGAVAAEEVERGMQANEKA